MLIFTNRVMGGSSDESAFGTSFTEGSDRLGLAIVKKTNAGAWAVSDADDNVDDADSMRALLPLFQATKPVLVYLHGNNNTPAKCFERCATLKAMYDVEVVGFSWPSEGYLSDGNALPAVSSPVADGDETDLSGVDSKNRKSSGIQSKIWRYHQSKTNAQHSVDAVARFFRMLGTARLYANAQPFTIAAHSLGAHLFQYSLDIPGAGEAVSTAQNIALLAPCVRASGHRDWLARVRPKGQLFVTFNKSDSVLAGASVADGGLTGDTQIKLGTDPTADRLRAPHMRYISFSNARAGFGGHSYFVQDNMPKKMGKVLARIFGSRRDLEADEYPRQVYPIDCDADRLTCYMAAPDFS